MPFFEIYKESLDYSLEHMHACCFISGLMAACPRWDSRVTGTNTRRVCRRIQASARLTLVAVPVSGGSTRKVRRKLPVRAGLRVVAGFGREYVLSKGYRNRLWYGRRRSMSAV